MISYGKVATITKIIDKRKDAGSWPVAGLTGHTYIIGFLAAVLAAAWILAFDIAAGLDIVFDLPDAALAFPAMMIAPPFVVLAAAIYRCTPSDWNIWGLVGLSFSIIYAAIIAINYILILTVVRSDPQILPAFTMEHRPDSAFWALETVGYTFMSLGALFMAPIFPRNRPGRIARWIFTINGISSLVATTAYLITLDGMHPAVVQTIAVWGVGFPIALTAVAVLFWRSRAL